MHTTRQRTKSSFTVEIKRANKRSPEVMTVARAGSTGDELAERVFGGTATPPERRPAGPGDVNLDLSGRFEVQPGPDRRLAESRPEELSSRRILPDLLATDFDPVQQRIRQEQEERAARRKIAVETRVANGATVRRRRVKVEEAYVPATAPEPPAAIARSAPVVSFARAAERAPAPETQKRIARPSALKRALKAGQCPPFPAGERWKRRLPKSCW